MSGPITRETFILAEEAMKIAVQLPTMWVVDGDDIKKVPVPLSVKETGTLPEGYTYDFLLDPLTLVSAMKEAGYSDLGSIKPETLKKVKGIINSKDNIAIIPISTHQAKLRHVEESLASVE